MNSRIARPLIAAGAGFAAVALVLVAAYYVGPLARWDATALEGMRDLSRSHRWIWVVNEATARSAGVVPLVLMLGALCAAGVAWGRRRQVVGAVALVSAAGIAVWLLKIAAAHPRYQPVLGSHQLDSTAFPSGHAAAAMSLALAAVMVVPRRLRLAAGIAGAGYALAVAIALMAQGWHFPSDLLAGFLIAGSVSMLVLAALRATERAGARAAVAGGHERPLRRAAVGVHPLELLGVGIALAAGALVLTQSGELASLAASHTTAALAAIAVGLGAVGVVCGVTAELETS